MDEPTQDAVMQRLERLERESRRWKALGMTAVALLGPIVLLGVSETHLATVAQEIRAHRVVLVDDAGHERGKFGVAPDGGAYLSLYNQRGRRGATLLVSNTASSLRLGLDLNAIYEPQRSVVLQVMEPMDVASLRLDNGTGTRISLDVSDFGATAVLLYRDEPIWSSLQPSRRGLCAVMAGVAGRRSTCVSRWVDM